MGKDDNRFDILITDNSVGSDCLRKLLKGKQWKLEATKNEQDIFYKQTFPFGLVGEKGSR